MPKVILDHGLKSDMPALREAQPGFTTDTEELFIGTAEGNNIQFAKQSDLDLVNAHGEEITEARGSFSLLGDRLDGVDEDLAESVTKLGSNTHSIQTTYTNGNLTQTKEFDVDNSLIFQNDITYNADGTVHTVTETINGKQYVTTLNYVNGSIDPVNPMTRSAI